ncbi:acyl-CoA dehydrogenase family protein [Marinobacter sp. CHS3-4]|uniref:acyl-CoA dehydrogenase family protein n=1 Tax=Marinobacter sp. CHS3-4 TaxID=3045174 RepID=UPI0024B5C908|nr:acyl-CoA dehydrogenase family protein [Marinobacter sp. CHS3-4]MDI9245364.1 acyl-CoA dehydrogenase family protein [Marinobacter sp. CHS3-4]
MLRELREDVIAWCDENVSLEKAAQLDAGECPISLYKQLAECGWLTFADITEAPDNLFRLAEVCKIVNSYSGVLGNMICVNAACAMMLGRYGAGDHKKLASSLLTGQKLSAFALTEPQAGTDVQGLCASAYRDGDHWQVNGEKYLTTGAEVADVLLIVTRSDPEVPMNRGTSLIAIPKDAPGLDIKPIPKMAVNGYASCHITLKNVRVPIDAAVGGANVAWDALALGGAIERLLVAACCVGLSRTIGEYLHGYAKERQIAGHAMYNMTNISHQIVDIAIQVRAADALVNEAIKSFLSGGNPTNAIAAAKSFAATMQQEVSMSAMKIMGGRAYLLSYPVERWLREGLLALWAGGTNELQKNLMARSPFER